METQHIHSSVVLLHRNWKKDGEYLPPPTIKGELVEIDPGLLVICPKTL